MKKELAIIQFDGTEYKAYNAIPLVESGRGPGESGLVLYTNLWVLDNFLFNIGGKHYTNLGDTILNEEHNALSNEEIKRIVRIRKANKGYRVWFPAASRFPRLPDFFNDWYRQDPQVARTAIEQAFPNIFAMDQPVDFSLGKPQGLLEAIKAFTVDPRATDQTEAHEGLDTFVEAIVGYRITSAPIANSKRLEHRDILARFTENQYEGNSTLLRADLTYLWGLRSFILFFEIFVSQKAAEYISQENGDDIKQWQIASWAQQYHTFIYSGRKEDHTPNVVSVSRIAQDNAESYSVRPNVNEHNIAVQRDGSLIWLPPSTDPAEVEAMIEVGGVQPDGDWTSFDAVNPEENEYVSGLNVQGTISRMKKQRGQNKIMYIDWHLGKLVYTNSSAKIIVKDISFFRPVQARQLEAYMNADITNTASPIRNAISNGLTFAVAIAKKLGIPFSPGEPDSFTHPQAFTRMLEEFNEHRLRIDLAIQSLQDALTSRRNADNTDIPAPVYRKLNAWVAANKTPTINILGPNAPSQFLRILHAYFVSVFDQVEQDPNAIFGSDLSVLNTLEAVTSLALLKFYAEKGKELSAQDETERMAYINPHLSPTDLIEVTDIPFTSGAVELMPHQVRVWNYLKNNPKNVVLGVDAGGGKTLLALLYCAALIGHKLAKKCLIVAPSNLVANFINDGAWLFKGRVNFIDITTSVIDSKQWGYENLLALVEAAPINTIFLSDYDFLAPKKNSSKVVNFVYGNTTMDVSLNTEFMRSIPWDIVIMDEAHYLKTSHGLRNQELNRLISSVPYKMQMSGTYIADSLTDVVGEFGLLDPTTFGSVKQFVDTYMSEENGAPIPGASRKIREAMAESACVINISRKEWAALLPRRSDAFHSVDMTEAQQSVYNLILTQAREDFKRDLEENPALKAAFGKRKNSDDTDEDEVDIDDLLDSSMNSCFQRLEVFLSAPSSDVFGKHLEGNDAISPKMYGTKEKPGLVPIIRDHIRSKTVGKIMVWTQYLESARATFNNLPEDLKHRAILYTAANANQTLGVFNSNPAIDILVGCEKSINTGLNLQIASRLIRLENPWNYAGLEQGESRINRPAKNDPRKEANGGHGIYYDWIFVNRSVGVTKLSRMFGKMLPAVQFYQTDSGAYDAIEVPPPPRMTLTSIFLANDWLDEETGCKKYFVAYQQYQQIQQREYDAYEADPTVRKEGYTLEDGGVLKGSALLVNIPYVPKMQIYNASELGLVPFLEYAAFNKGSTGTPLWDDPAWSPKGLNIHCEYGDCVAIDYNYARSEGKKPKTMRISAPDGSVTSVPLTACWVITKAVTKGLTVKERLYKSITGISPPKLLIPTKPSIDVGRGVSKRGSRLPEKDPKGKLGGFELFVTSYDNLPTLMVNGANPNVADNISALKRLGFVQLAPYYAAPVRSVKSLRAWIKAVNAAGVQIDAAYKEMIDTDVKLLVATKDPYKYMEGIAKSKRLNFLKNQKTPAPNGTIRPYLVIVNGGNKAKRQISLCLNKQVNASSLSKLKGLSNTGIQFGPVHANEWAAFFRNKVEMQATVDALTGRFEIENLKELKQDIADVRVFQQLNK